MIDADGRKFRRQREYRSPQMFLINITIMYVKYFVIRVYLRKDIDSQRVSFRPCFTGRSLVN